MHIYVSIQLFSVVILYCRLKGRLTVTAVPFLFYSGHIKAQTPAHTNLAAAVQQACLCYYWWWMCVISSIPLNRRVSDPCVGPDWPQDLWASSGYGLLMKLHVCQGVCVSTHLIISPQIWVTRKPADVQIIKNPSNKVCCRETLPTWKACVFWLFIRERQHLWHIINNICCLLLCWLVFVASVFGGGVWNWSENNVQLHGCACIVFYILNKFAWWKD